MGKNRSPGRARRETEDYIDLGKLLSDRRDEEVREALDAIVSSDLSAREKVRAIRALDEEARSKPEQKGEGQLKVRALRYGWRTLKDILRLPQTRTPYILYLFGDYRRILAFGHVNRVLDPTVFPPHLRVNPAVPGFMSGVLKSWVSELSGILTTALEDSWRYLRKIEYNLLVAVKQLCERIQSENFGLLDYRGRHLIDKLRSLELLFLVLHYRGEYLELVLGSLREASERDPRLSGSYSSAAGLITKLLRNDQSSPSLYNILLGLNMLKYQRFLTLDQLICRDLGELVNTREYACSPAVREKIGQIVIEARARLGELREKQAAIRRLKSFLRFDEHGAVSFEPLGQIYGRTEGDQGQLPFDEVRDNLAIAVPRLLEACDRTFYPLLNGQVQLESHGNVSLFTHDFFQLDFLRIRRVLRRLENLPSIHGKLSRSRFRELQGAVKGIDVAEAETLKNVNEAMEIVCATAAKVQALLAQRRRAEGPVRGPLDPRVLGGKGFALPHEARRLRSADVLDGMTVAEALAHFVLVCNTLAVFVYFPPVFSPLEEEQQVAAELQTQVEILGRLTDRGRAGGSAEAPPEDRVAETPPPAPHPA